MTRFVEVALLAIVAMLSVAGLVVAPTSCFGLLLVVGLPVAALGALVTVVANRRQRARLRQLSSAELEGLVWRYEPEYFNWLGADDASIVEFKRLVDSRDLRSLAVRWRVLDRDFARLEHRRGHRGRPMIMDYYYEMDGALAELVRRASHTMPPNTHKAPGRQEGMQERPGHR